MNKDQDLIQACLETASKASARAEKHLSELQRQEALARDLRASVQALLDASEERRLIVQRRWILRTEIRKARAILANAQPVPTAGRAMGLRKFWHQRAAELVEHWWKRATPWPPGYSGPGIYALFLGNELVYIGQSMKVAIRIGQHTSGKVFTHASYVSVPADRLDEFERLLLNVFQPRLNVDGATQFIRRKVRTAFGMDSGKPARDAGPAIVEMIR